MRIDELIVEVRDASLERVGQVLPADLVGFKAVLRFNNVGSWEVTLPHDHLVGSILREPGSGIIVTGPNGVILSGPTTSATNSKTPDDPDGIWLIKGVDDSIILGERLAYPTPTSADVTAQSTAYDVRSGVASTVIYQYVDANIGPSAPLAREVPGLTMATDPGIGSTVYGSARFDILGELISGLASVDTLGFDIKQVDGTLEFSVFQPVDRTAYIRMDVKNNTLAKTEYAYGSHGLSRAIVAGKGTDATRLFVEVTSTESLAAETLWGRRIESFIDQRNTDNTDELSQAGKEALADGGTTLTSIDVVPSSDLTMTYGSDWDLGDLVTVDVGGQEVSALVTTVSMTIGEDGVRVGATVGNPTGVDYEALVTKTQTKTASRVNALERKEGASGGSSGGSAGLMTQTIKNDQGASVTLGQAVYISGANGTNVLVKLAKADAELTSSKTLGLLAQNLSTNGLGTVVTEGMLAGLNTSAAQDGDPVWLSPTTAGGLIYGMTGKPSAPNHLVFIGFVLRANANNGEIYVKVQNGFENDELHDRLTFVGDTAPASPKDYYFWFKSSTGEMFFRYNDGDSSQWVQVNNGTVADAALTQRVTLVEGRATSLETRATTLEGVRAVSIGGTGASTLTSGGYLKGNGTSAITAQAGIPASDITSGTMPYDRMPAGSIIQVQTVRYQGRPVWTFTNDSIITYLNVPITPRKANSLLICDFMVTGEAEYNAVFRSARDGSLISQAGYEGYNTEDTNIWSGIAPVIYDTNLASTPFNQFLRYYAPANSTAATTMQIAMRPTVSGATAKMCLNRTYDSNGASAYEIGVSYATVWEVAQ